MDTPTRIISEYASHPDRVNPSPDAVAATLRHLIDTVACALGALDGEPARVARALARTASGDPGASVIGLGRTTTPELAAFANTILVRYLDYNDTGNGGHPSDMIPAVLALAEAVGASGSQVIRAIHAQYEVVAALRRGGLYGNLLRHRHVDQVFTLVGGAVGVGMILGLDEETMAHAISLALTPNIPMRVARTGTLSHWKGCATAHCAMSAVFATRLAQAGMTGPAAPFEGSGGFYQLIGMEPLRLDDIGQPRNGLGAVASTGLKYFPTDYNAQGPLGCLLALRPRFRLDDLEAVRISLHWSGWHAIGGGADDRDAKWDPRTRETADHSMAYLAAVALADGVVTLDSFTEARIRDPALRPLMQRITVEEDPELSRRHAGELPRWPSAVEILLRDGQLLQASSETPKGHPLNPLTDVELEAKFWSMSDRALPRHRGQQFLDTLWSLETLPNIRELTDQFRFDHSF